MSLTKWLLAAFLLFTTSVALAQPTQEWVARYNGSGNYFDVAEALAVDGDGNVYVTGWSIGSDTGTDYATIKYDSNGDTVWVRCYNGSGNKSDGAYALAVHASGNVCVTGYSGDWPFMDYATIRYDSNGDTAWVRRYNGSGNNDDAAFALAVDASGKVYVTGLSTGSGTDYDYATIKYKPSGDTVWVRRYNGPGNYADVSYALALDASGNVYVTGNSTGSGTDYDYATIKYKPNGDTVWVRRYNGPGNGRDDARALTVDGSDNVYVTGLSTGSGTDYDYATIKYDPNGDTVWVRRYNGPGNGWDEACAIEVDGSGNVYVTGLSTGSGADYDYATIKYDFNGDTVWVRRYNGSGNSRDAARALTVDASGNVYVTGLSTGSGTDYDYATLKYDPNGDTVWVAGYNGSGNGCDEARALAVDSSGNVYVTGLSTGSGTDYDYATIKYSQIAMSCDISEWPVCRGTRVFFSVTYTNYTGSPINRTVTFLAYSGYDCDPYNQLIQIRRNRTIPIGTTTYYYYGEVPSAVQPGEYSISVDFEHGGNSYYCCMNTDVIQCSPWKEGTNTEWEVVEVDGPEAVVPMMTELYGNYPNPFNATTQFTYSLAQAGKVKLTIHNLRGQLLETVVDGQEEAGEHQVIWDASDYSSGVYFYKLQAGDFVSTKKMNLLK